MVDQILWYYSIVLNINERAVMYIGINRYIDMYILAAFLH